MTPSIVERKDLIAGTLIAGLMAIMFSRVGGRPLMVTFLPALAVCWVVFLGLSLSRKRLPESGAFFPIYFTTLAWQFIHFAEEYVTDFNVRFPRLYGAAPFSPDLFVTFNMVSYFVFAAACLLVFTKRLTFLLIPVLFFLVYGAIGNAIAHTWWVILQKSYFPGFYTAQVYWILGPLALTRLLGSRREALFTVVVLAALLIPLLALFRRES